MPTNIKIIHTQDFIRADAEGTLDLNASRKILKDLLTTVDTGAQYHVLIDTRAADVRLSTIDIYTLAVAVAEEPTFAGNRRLAILVRPEEHVNAHFFETVASTRGRIIRAFTDFETAITWLIMDWSVT